MTNNSKATFAQFGDYKKYKVATIIKAVQKLQYREGTESLALAG